MGRRRPGFDQEWGREVARRVRSYLEEGPLEAFPPATVTDDASLRRGVARCREAGCEVLLVLQPTMGDGRLAPLLARLWDGPVVLWATPERPEVPAVSSNSLVGTHLFASTLRQLGRPFEVVYGDPADGRLRHDLEEALRACSAARRLRGSKVGIVGHHAPGFVDLHPDPFLMSRSLGVEMVQLGLHEFVELASSFGEEEVLRDAGRVLGMGLPFAQGVGEGDLPTSSRYYLAMRRLFEEEGLDALALRCWPELPEVLGQWAYLAMVRLLEEGLPVAMEGDVDGAVCGRVGALVGAGPGYLSDWLEHDARTITLWHPGNAPLSMCEPVGGGRGPRLARHFNVPRPMVVDADLRAGEPVTLFRLWRCDGRYMLVARDARTVPPRRPLPGTNGLVELPEHLDGYRWFEELCHAGMPHHLTVLPGHNASVLRRLARQLGVRAL